MDFKKALKLLLLLVIPVAMFFSEGCRKEQFGDGPLAFSTDTLTFDTVFATLGSTTKYFKIFNNSRSILKVSDIRLMRLTGNQFRINVDGIKGDHFTDIEIPAQDSLYIFVEVTVNPNDQTNPFVIVDDVKFVTNGNEQTVHLQAWGQNAVFHYGETLTTDVEWNNTLPHVIISRDTMPGVFVKCGATLNIKPGCKIYFVGNSAMFVEGTLRADEGNSWNDSIVFEGSRLENFYDDKPGQWFGIVFLRKNDCPGRAEGFFKYCIINESSYSVYVGASVDPAARYPSYFSDANKSPAVVMSNTIVKNSLYHSLYTFHGKITAKNCLFYTSGDNLAKLSFGGTYDFTHCTFYNGSSRYINHEKEILWLGNAVDSGGVGLIIPLVTKFENSVIYGTVRNEISFNNAGAGLSTFNNTFRYCDIKTNRDTLGMNSSDTLGNLFNADPLFKDVVNFNFTPRDSAGISPLIDACPANGTTQDIFDKQRSKNPLSSGTFTNDIGAVESGQ